MKYYENGKLIINTTNDYIVKEIDDIVRDVNIEITKQKQTRNTTRLTMKSVRKTEKRK